MTIAKPDRPPFLSSLGKRNKRFKTGNPLNHRTTEYIIVLPLVGTIMKKLTCIAAALLALTSCSNGNAGRIDCYSIRVTSSSGTSFTKTYHSQFTCVYEYKSKDGGYLYAGALHDGADGIWPITVVEDRYSGNYVLYTYVRFVGVITLENNYYFEPATRTIDMETKWSERKDNENPQNQEKIDNKEAFEKAKTGYYYVDQTDARTYTPESSQTGGYAASKPCYVISLDTADNRIEKHTYLQVGDDYNVEYTPKWH